MLPNFLLIGAAKAGTTSLHQLLDQHPEIFMSRVKEPGFFAFEGTNGRIPMLRNEPFVTDLAQYEALFDDAAGATVVGESSPFYLEFASAEMIGRIKRHLSDVRLLAVLRHPVDQAYSRFVMWQRGEHTGDIGFREQFLRDFENFHDLDYDFDGPKVLVRSYHDRLRLFREAFEATTLKIMFHEDFVADPRAFLSDIYRFLGVDPDFRNDLSVRANEGGLYRSAFVSTVMNRPNPLRWLSRRLIPDERRAAMHETMRRRFSKPAPRLDPLVRKELTDLMAREISALERLTGRDLSGWRNPAEPCPAPIAADPVRS